MSTVIARTLLAASLGGAVAARVELTDADAAIRGILPTTRRIGVMSLGRGIGTSSVAFHLSRAIATRRRGPVLAIDVSTDGGLATRRAAAPVAPDPTRSTARTTAQALSGLSMDAGVVTLRPLDVDDPIRTWLAEAAPITRFFDVSITDFGTRHPADDLAECAAVCDVVCLVSDGRRSPVEHARALLPAIAALPEAPSVALALVDHARAGEAVARAVAIGSGHPVVPIPFDTGLRRGLGVTRALTHRRLLRLAGTLIRLEEGSS